ncbi:hypothetical protein [Paeniglutamicibacter antarcticus]|uniref:hypothetical protein n=1 Tax=Paeniglutamicibacter antarcticus TaxID=494023 RepID=UPI001AE3F736
MKDHGLRIVRGWIGALICTGLAAASHALADGQLPPLPILGLLLCVSAVVCTALAANKISWLRTALAVGVSQGIYHGAFALFGRNHQASALASEGGIHAGHAAHGVSLGLEVPVTAVAAVDLHSSGLMATAHLGAALLTVIALRKGEISVRAIADAIFLYLPRSILFICGFQAAWGKQPLLDIAYESLVLRDVLRPALRRRGPPAGPAFAIL